VGATLAEAWLDRLRAPRNEIERVAHLVRQHMFAYEPGWSDAAVRRFVRRVGAEALDELIALRAADNVGSGQPPGHDRLDELARRCREQLAARVALRRGDLAIDGHDLARIGITPGPRMGHVLEELLDRVIADPMLNDRARLLELAREIAGGLAATDGPSPAAAGTAAAGTAAAGQPEPGR
jgi:tRNA nucleotidyltransferase (CCA-adding enzyme)